MDRKTFIKAGLGLPLLTMNLNDLESMLPALEGTTALMPAMFIGHGNPMNAITDNKYHQQWQKMGKELPVPRAILCISAHWQTRGTKVTAMEKPKTIHDFGGFPKALFDVQYRAPGSPAYAAAAIEAIKSVHVEKDQEWGLDHGCWSVIRPMFPEAKIPVFQLSLDYLMKPEQHFEIGKQLRVLRSKGVLIVGSGNIVHNLAAVSWDANETGFDWAIEFDQLVKEKIRKRDFTSLQEYRNLGRAAKLSIPTNEHYLPLLYVLGMSGEKENLSFFNESLDMGSISMTSVLVGGS